MKESSESKQAQYTEHSWLLLDSEVPICVTNETRLSYCSSYLCDPNCRPYRYTIAILVSMVEGILTYCCQYPAGIQSTMIRVMNLDNTHYDMFFSAYTWPDIIMSIMGTVVIDRFLGIRKGIVLFTVIVLIGQIIVSIGAYTNVFHIMLVGRLSIGCGMGTGLSVTSSFLVTWFSGSEITFIFAISRCIHRLYATLALFSPQLVYESLSPVISSSQYRHGTTQMTCTIICLCAVLCAVLASLLDFRGAKIVGRKKLRKKIKLIDILTFSSSYWILIFSCSLFFSVIVAFTANAPLFYISKYGMTEDGANIANAISYLGIVFITPFMGILIDVTGYNLIWGIFGILFAILGNIATIIGERDDSFIPYIAALLYSMSFTFFGSAIWVAIGYLVAKHQLTTAYGLTLSFFAINLTVINLCFGVIIDHVGYLMLGILCISFLFIILLLNAYLSVAEVVNGNRVLNISGSLRKK